MGFKSKLGVGVMTGVMGLSLIGGGTYAAFNDVEEVSNTFTAGTLDLAADQQETFKFDISNLKPGDYFKKTIHLDNNGSLDINQILTQVSADGWENKDQLGLEEKFGNKAKNNKDDFLSQFQVRVYGDNGFNANATLDEVVNHTNGNGFDITRSGENSVGLESGNQLKYDIVIAFLENDQTFEDSRYQVQNKFQGEGATLDFDFEATQMPGEDRSNQ